MRQALLVIVLVGAAFGGGALVSGPGFRWAQEHLLDYMGLKDGGEIDTLDLTPPPGAAGPTAEPLAGPSAAQAKAQAPAATAPSPAPTPPPRATEPYVEAKPTPAPTPAEAPAEPAKAPALLGALNAMLSPPQTTPPPGAAAEPAPADPAIEPSSLPTLEAAPAPASASATEGASGEWAEIRRKLDAAGVSRYTIEGEPGGRVVFACLIPLAGKQAVSQRFEAEGDDEFQAARSALKRINLWRASHSSPANP